MKTLALDQATIITGYAVFDGGDLCEHGVIDLHKEKDEWERVQLMRIRVDELIAKHKPSVVIFEDVMSRVNPQSLIKLGRLQGLLMASALSRGIPICTYYPTTWRKILGIKQGGGVKRAQLKEQVIDFVFNAYGFRPSEDEAEAIGIGVAHYIKEISAGETPAKKE